MAEPDKKMWGIHTQDEALFLKMNKIAIGWRQMGDLSKIPPSREDFKTKYFETFPDAKKGSVPTSSGMLYRFCYEVQIGDYVVYPSKSDRMINIGEVTGDYVYDPEQPEYVQVRSVKWLRHFPRMAFSQGALYEIGSAMSFFTVKNYADEFLAALDKGFKNKSAVDDEDETVGATADEIIESTKDFILKEAELYCSKHSLALHSPLIYQCLNMLCENYHTCLLENCRLRWCPAKNLLHMYLRK